MLADAPVIAVLDDEMEMRKAISRLLHCHGFRVEGYESGESFLAAVGTRSLDCLLLDLHMEGINGFDVLEVLRSRRVSLPVVVITAHDEPDTEARVLALGAAVYLKKPADQDVLLAAIDTARSVSEDSISASDRSDPAGSSPIIAGPTMRNETATGRMEEPGMSVDEETHP